MSRYNLRSRKHTAAVPTEVTTAVVIPPLDEPTYPSELKHVPKPRRKVIPKNVKIRAAKSIRSLFFKKLILFRLKNLLRKAKAVSVIARVFRTHRFRKSLRCMKNMILFYKEKVDKITESYQKYILRKKGRQIFSSRLNELVSENSLKQEEVNKIYALTTYLKHDRNFLQIVRESKNYTCMMCLEEIPQRHMIHSINCSNCNPSYCQFCWRKLMYRSVGGIYKFSRKMFDCLFCTKPIVLHESIRKSLHHPNLDKEIIHLFFKILFSIGFEESVPIDEMFSKFTSDDPFKLTYSLVKTARGAKFMFLSDKESKLLSDFRHNKIPEETPEMNPITPSTNDIYVMNIMTYERHVFNRQSYINQYIESTSIYTFSKLSYVPNRDGMLNVIYKTLFRNCKSCKKCDIIGWKKPSCGEEEVIDYYCTRCTDPSVKICPACGIYCTRIDGCNEMTCACGIVWCYHCNTQNMKINRSRHYITNSFGPCKGAADAMTP